MDCAVCLSGWGQPFDALSSLFPKAKHVDYARHKSVKAALKDIASHNPEIVIGWSLGGQLAARAIAGGLMLPKKLILIAAPFQFVAPDGQTLGMKRFLYDKFRDNYARDPDRTLRKSWELIVKDDTRVERVRAHLARQTQEKALQEDWLQWLNLLDGFSCDSLSFVDFPPTLLIHGERDVIVAPEQSRRFARELPEAHLEIYKGAGHAPHWHDEAKVKRMIEDFTHV